jgi:RNA polymerase sigma factor for flagellar operon FliA
MRATKPKPKTNIQIVWKRFRKTGDPALRNALMENYLPIVRFTADRVGAKLPDEVDRDDLISAGVFGLMDAIQAFDPKRGVKFETYCAPRIRGAILDALRSMDWVPRLVRTRAQKIEQATRALEAVLGRTPSEQEIADRMKLPPDEYVKVLRDSTAVSQISLSRKYSDTDSNKEMSEIDLIEDKRGRDPVSEVLRKDLKELVTRGLTRAERLILILYYYEEMTMKEIGAVLNLSESRVSQMHSAIMTRLKDQLEKRRRELTQHKE